MQPQHIIILVINSFIIIEDNDNNKNDESNALQKDNEKYLEIFRKRCLCEWSLLFLLFLKPIIGTSGNTFLLSSSLGRITFSAVQTLGNN